MADETDQYWPSDWTGMQAGAFAPPLAGGPGPAQAPERPTDVSDAGLAFLKGREGWEPKAKWDYKQWSVGYGSKAKDATETLTPEEGEARMRQDLAPSVSWLNKNVTGAIAPHQYDALASFGYNVGTGGLDKLKDDINAGNWQRVADRMQTWNKAGGKELADLKDRRWQEGTMLLGGQVQPRTPATTGSTGGTRAMVPADDDGGDLGSNLQQKPSLMGLLSNPQTQGMLAGMAARLLTGGWGGPMSQIGQGLGAGFEQAGNVQVYERQQEQEQKKLDQAAKIAKEHNETQIKVAQMHADTMKSLVQARTTAAGLNRNDPEWIKLHQGYQNDVMTLGMDPTERDALAIRRADEAYMHMKGVTGGGSGGIGVGTGPAGATAANPAATGAIGIGTGAPAKSTPPSTAIDSGKYTSDPEYKKHVDELYKKNTGRDPIPGIIPDSPIDQLLRKIQPEAGFFKGSPWNP